MVRPGSLVIVYTALCFLILGRPLSLEAQQRPLNIIFVLADDHPYDAMGFLNKIPGLQTDGKTKETW